MSVECRRPMAFLELYHNLLKEIAQEVKTETPASEF